MSQSDSLDFDAFWEALNHENLTEAQYLDRILGPKYLPIKLVVPLTLAYVTIFVTGVVGNVITCTVIVKNSNMHTPTNYYLFSLAISDLILLTLGLPNELSVFWEQYPWKLGVALCKIRAYVSEMSSYVSVLTIVGFSVERYLAICHPLRVYAMSAMKRPVRFILGAWLIALGSAIPFAIYTRVNYVEYPPDSDEKSLDSAICAMLLPDMPNYPLYELSCLIFFLIPLLILIVLYTRMGLEIRASARVSIVAGNTAASDHWESKRIQRRQSIVRMLSTVVVMFFVCWAPFHAQRLFYVYAQEADYYPDLNEWLYITSGFLYYFGTTVNPILYNILSTRYREAFKRTLCRCRAANTTDSLPKRPKSSRIYARETNLRRFTYDQAKEMFRFVPNREVSARDGALPNDFTRKREIVDENCPNEPLLRAKHPIAGQQPSNESTSSQNIQHETLSTASSAL